MHGIKRTRLSASAAEARRLKDQELISKYVVVQKDVLDRKRELDYSPEALGKTTELLDENPEFYTVWNYRRYILLRGLFPTSTAEEIVKLLTADLRLTTAYLQRHPKVYWIWTHRRWCLENVPAGPDGTEEWRCQFWKMELMLIEKMLESDPRNFHAWDYRRYVLQSLPSSFKPARSERDELRYTQKKIEANFSNFSAWHTRTKLFGRLWPQMEAEEVEKERSQELELVRQALWTDPGDQSAWLYHRWLIGTDPDERVLRAELDSIRELNETEPDSRWCINALAHYYRLLGNLPGTPGAEKTRLRSEAVKMYERLQVIDSDRIERYRDMARLVQDSS